MKVVVFVHMAEKEGFVEYVVALVFVSMVMNCEFVGDVKKIFARDTKHRQHVIQNYTVHSAKKNVFCIQNNQRNGLIWVMGLSIS